MSLLTKAKQLHDQGFSVIPTNIRKAPVIGTGWQEYVDDNRIEPNGNFAQSNVKGVGIVLGAKIGDYYLAAIDVDCYNKTVSRMMCDYIADQSQTGTITYRVGQPPKFLVPYLSPTQVKKTVSSSFNSGEEKDSKIERLGKGQQFVAYGKQENGEYKWYNGDLDINTLPVFDEVDIVDIFVVFEQLADKYGMVETDRKDINPFGNDDDDPFASIAKPPLDLDTSEVVATLKEIDPATLSYQEWINVGMALHHQYGGNGEAYDMWNMWSKQDKKRYKGEEMRFKWDSFGNSERTVTFATVIMMSKKSNANALAVEVAKDVEPRRFRSADELLSEGIKAPEWLVRDMIERDSLVMSYGASGAGKSYVAIRMAVAIATGADFHKHPTKQGTVVYMCGEGYRGIISRLNAIKIHDGLSTLGSLHLTNRITDFSSAEDVKATANELVNAGITPDLIIVDTLARASGGYDENSTADMNNFIKACDYFRRKFNGCTIMPIHHTGKGDKGVARGSSVLKAAVDVEMMVENTGEGLVVSSTKMKDGEPFDKLGFTFIRINFGVFDQDNHELYSHVVEPDQSVVAGAGVKQQLKKHGKAVLKVFEQMWDDGDVRTPAPHKFMQRYGLDAPSEGFWESDLEEAVKRSYAGKDDTKYRAWKNGIDECVEKDVLAVWDGIVVKL